MKKQIFCLYSGGLKSVGNLWYILSNPKYNDYIIHIHHIHILNYENHAKAEAHAVKQTLDFILKQFKREFIISENQINFNCLPKASKLPNNLDICAFVASQYISVNPDIAYILVGYSKEDNESNYLKDISRFNLSLERAKELNTASKEVSLLSPLQYLSRNQINLMLPEETRSFIWSCTTPIYIEKGIAVPCSNCIKCTL